MNKILSLDSYKKMHPLVPPILVFAFIFPFFKDILLSPGSFLLLMGSDGIKNYYTYSWYIVNNKELLNFTGMNYPYGESIFYLDSQPLLSVLFYFIRNIFPDFENYITTILNLIIIFSPVISAYFIYRVFKVLNISTLLSITASVGLALLAPQFHRFASHLALSYSFIIPITIYLLIIDNSKISLSRQVKMLSVYILLLFLIHAYLGMIAALLTGLFYVSQFLAKPGIKSFSIYFIKAIIASILPTIIFFIIITFTDSHTGRNTNPSGFFEYVASFSTILLQSRPFSIINIPITPPWDQWEGWAYIGIFSILFFIPAVLLLIYRQLTRNYVEKDTVIICLLVSSIIMLAFSFAFPFKYGLKHLIEVIPLIKKFRSVGRFAWVFYYVSGILAVWYLNIFTTTKVKKLIFGLLPLLFVIEAFPVYKSYAKFTNKTPNFFNINLVDSKLKKLISVIDSEQYQAIIPLPFYHIGSENFGKIGTEKIYKESMILSYHTHLPLFSTYLTHTSIWESKNIMQLLSPSCYDKAIKDAIHSSKDVIIYWSNEPLNKYEKELLNRSSEVFKGEDGSLYRISIEKLFDHESANNVNNFEEIKKDLIYKNGHYLKNEGSTFYCDDYDRYNRDTTFLGSGSFYGINGKDNLLAKLVSVSLKPNQPYILSYWKYNNGENFGQGMLNALGLVRENKGWLRYGAPKWSCTINGDWTLFELEFTPKINNGLIDICEIEYSISLKGNRSIIDELMIYPKSDTIYKEMYSDKGEFIGVLMNNHPLLKNNKPFIPNICKKNPK